MKNTALFLFLFGKKKKKLRAPKAPTNSQSKFYSVRVLGDAFGEDPDTEWNPVIRYETL